MALRDLVKAVSPEFATDREIQGDQVDLKINDLRRDLWAVCDAIDGLIGGGGPPTGPASGDLSGTYPGPVVAKIRSTLVDTVAPALGDALVYDGAKYTPSAVGGGGGPPTGCTPSIPNAYIKICKQIVDPVSVGESPQEAVSFVVLHELGHVWGKKEHALCNEHRIMSPSYGCLYKGHHLKYQLQDIEDICSAGKVIGGVCK